MGAVAVVGAIVFFGTLLPFVRPAESRPRAADAVVVLSGDYGERLAFGLRLVNAGLAPTLVLAGQPDSRQARRLCGARVAFEVVCLRPRPDNTRTEAQATAELATQRGWRRILVATSTPHVTRSKLLFRRCVEGDVQVVGATPRYGFRVWSRVIAHEWLGTAQSLIAARRC